MMVHDIDGMGIAYKSLTKRGMMRVDEGEAWGLMKALRWAESLGQHFVEVETDCKRVCDAYASSDIGRF